MPHRCRSGDTQKSGQISSRRQVCGALVVKSKAVAQIMHMYDKPVPLAWVLTFFSFFTCSTLLANSSVSASTWACMHVTPPQHSQQATQAWAHNRPVFTCSTLLANSSVSASTWACMHVTPPQHSQQATQAWAHNRPEMLHSQLATPPT